jgi:hypothetical protein
LLVTLATELKLQKLIKGLALRKIMTAFAFCILVDQSIDWSVEWPGTVAERLWWLTDNSVAQ